MSRIDEIKERNEADFSHVSGDLSSMMRMKNWRADFCERHHKKDIVYLLSRLEIAEKALEAAMKKFDSDDHQTLDGENWIRSIEQTEEYKLVKETLQQLRA